jgi:trimeric autotransporter adhesin
MKSVNFWPSRALLRALTGSAVVVAAFLIAATPALASGGGSGGGGTSSTPPIQLSPDSVSVTSGASSVIQIVVSPAAPSGGETLTVTASNTSVTVPSTVPISGGSSFGQFDVTGNTVTAATPVTVTVSLGTTRTSTNLTVNPATAASAASVAIFPRVVAEADPVKVDVSLTAPAPAGGATVTLASDSAALPVPANVVVPTGATLAQVSTTAGAVNAATTAQVSGSFGGGTATGQVEIDPSRDLTDLVVSPITTDGTKGSTGQVSISVPANGNNYTVALTSSNPTVATVPESVTFLSGQQSASFPISTTAVNGSTDVTITASVAGQTKTTTLTVAPTPPPAFDLQTVKLSPAIVAGAGTATAKITTTTGAPAGGVTIPVSSSDSRLATVPASVFLPAGATSVSFPVKVPSQSNSVNVGISALFNQRGHSGQLGVTPANGGRLLQASTANQVLAPRPVNDPSTQALGFYQGGTASVESGQMPPGISLLSPFRPGEFVFTGSPQRAGTYTFVLKFTNVTTPYTMAYVWVITPN